MSQNARLLIPAIRWDQATGFGGQRSHIERALSLGCGGYIFFGGDASAVKELVAELRERSAFPLLVAADLERGAGQQFAGASGLPPLAAIGATSEKGAASRAGRLTAREALSLGVNWVLAPVCDLDLEKENPIVGTRSFGADSRRVSQLVSEWIAGCQAAGAMACAKHFPAMAEHLWIRTLHCRVWPLVRTSCAPATLRLSLPQLSLVLQAFSRHTWRIPRLIRAARPPRFPAQFCMICCARSWDTTK